MNDISFYERQDFSLYKGNWASMSYCLSLDIVVPLHVDMGLVSPKPETLPQFFRQVALEIGERKNCMSLTDLMIRDHKNKLRIEFGEEWLRHFSLWFSTIYTEDASGWAGWRSLLEVVADSIYYDELKTGLGISNNKIMLLKRYKEYCFFWEQNLEDQAAKRLRELRDNDLGYWDQELIQQYNYRIEYVEDERAALLDDRPDIFHDVIRTIGMRRFQLGWEILWGNFTSTEKNRIAETGERFLNSLSSNQHNYFLPHPDTLASFL